MNAYPTTPSIVDPVRIPLPAGQGSSVAIEGVTYTADGDGLLTVPRAVATALAPHLLQPAGATPVVDISEIAARIKLIDGELGTLQQEHAGLEAAARMAGERLGVTGDPGPDVGELTARHKRSLGDLLLGLVKRVDVDAIEAERKKAATRAAEQSKARELAALGAAELNERKQPIEARARELEDARGALIKRAVLASAQQAAIEARAAAIEYGKRLAVVNAHAALLRDPKVLQQLPAVWEVPSVPQLAAFADAPGFVLRLSCDEHAVRRGQAQEHIDFTAAREEVQQRLAAHGIPT